MSNPRVYGTVVNKGLRHMASGVIGGTFARSKSGWDTYTVCGQYLGCAIETDEDLVVTCIRCLGRRAPEGSILRGCTADVTIIDEVQDMENAIVAALQVPREYVLGTPSAPPAPSRARRRVSRR